MIVHYDLHGIIPSERRWYSKHMPSSLLELFQFYLNEIRQYIPLSGESVQLYQQSVFEVFCLHHRVESVSLS